MCNPVPLTLKLQRCPNCAARLIAPDPGRVVRTQAAPAAPLPDFLAELRRNFRYEPTLEEAILEATRS